ncbi:MAG: hypothetical protein CVU39_17875 [Chloroflexi bacterium HGW-Chloroflexi-10]|nr:MAG: hypothetical protein CVU39_17875 [Chloroflexi bacterium HGW-Chloroflexi-10]
MITNITYTYITKLLLALTILLQGGLSAQISTRWITPVQIPNYQDTARAPLLVPDNQGSVHVFNYESVGQFNNAIMYRRWNPEEGWTTPNDILLLGLGGGPQTLQAVFLDSNDFFHVIYYFGTDEEGYIYYSSAPRKTAHRATAWSTPIVIGDNAGPLPFAALTQDINGVMYVFFISKVDGIGLYMVKSEDSGLSWSQPLAMTIISQEDRWPAAIQAMSDSNGGVHVVWSIVSDLGVGEEIHYGRLNAAKNALEKDTILARREGMDYSATWPAIVDDGSQLLLVYQDSFPATRFMRVSKDYGDTWSFPIKPFPFIGEYEFTAIAKDSNNNLHMVMGNRTENPEIHGMWYSRWLGNRWSTLEPITSGPATAVYDPSAPQAVVTQGNILFAAWWHNVRNDNLSGAWYSYRLLDAPALLSTPDTNETIPTEINLIPDDGNPTINATSEPLIVATPSLTPMEKAYSPAFPIYIALIPVVILMAVFTFLKFQRR